MLKRSSIKMIKRTHLAIAAALALLFLPIVTHKIVFLGVILVAALLPDIDSPTSYFGHYKIWRPVQFIVEHRGIFHSLTLCIFVSLVFALVLPVLALPFFLGYSSHLFADSFTKEGITPFWPWKRMSQGILTTGTQVEFGIFITFLAIDLILLVRLFL
jgi:inner membrane protein